MGPANLAGPGAIDLSELPRLSAEELLKRIAGDSWVVDLRDKDSWAKAHLAGTMNFGISGSFATYLGWLFPYEKELVLISDKANDISVAQRELVRIGIDRPSASFVGAMDNFAEILDAEVVQFKDVPEALTNSEIVVLDVRRNSERQASHIKGSKHIPLHELEGRLGELSTEKIYWVHCAGAYRASIATSIIQNAGLKIVLINEPYEKALEVKELEIVSGSADHSPVAPSDLKAKE
jgi:rhodanese-related sulfurtransferase